MNLIGNIAAATILLFSSLAVAQGKEMWARLGDYASWKPQGTLEMFQLYVKPTCGCSRGSRRSNGSATACTQNAAS